eukprot:10534246-Alexandrium_andersonii.AAC.1
MPRPSISRAEDEASRGTPSGRCSASADPRAVASGLRAFVRSRESCLRRVAQGRARRRRRTWCKIEGVRRG